MDSPKCSGNSLAARLLLGGMLAVSPLMGHTTEITIQVNDAPGEGFNDRSPRNPVAGNTGTTLGEQRLNVFQAAADYWEQRLDSDVEIVVEARFAPLECSPFSGVLGQAGPQAVHTNFINIPEPDVLYAGALANSLAGFDLSPTRPEIGTTFNSLLDDSSNCLGGFGWDYRLGVNADSSRLLYSVVLHELAHGLGFLTFVNINNGSTLGGRDDSFMRNLFDVRLNRNWSDMTNSERRASSTSNGSLAWSGPLAANEANYLDQGLTAANLPRMYAPSSLQPGSSVSHWDSALTPDELMEPQSRPQVEDWLTTKAFYDMGWQGNPCVESRLPSDQWIMLSIDCELPPDANTVVDAFGDDIPGDLVGPNATNPTWTMFRFDPDAGDAGAYIRLSANDAVEPGVGYWIIQRSGDDVVINVPRQSTRTPSESPDCPRGDSCFVHQLSANSGRRTYHLIGNPFRFPVAMDDVLIRTSNGACNNAPCTPFGADNFGYVPFVAFTWQAGSREYTQLGAGDVIPAKASVWVATNSEAAGRNVRMIYRR